VWIWNSLLLLVLCIAESICKRLLSFPDQNQIYKSIVIHFWNIKTHTHSWMNWAARLSFTVGLGSLVTAWFRNGEKGGTGSNVAIAYIVYRDCCVWPLETRMISDLLRNFCDLQLYHYTVNPCFVRDWEELPWFRTVCFIRSFRGHCFLKSHGCLPQWRCATITCVILLCVSACFIS